MYRYDSGLMKHLYSMVKATKSLLKHTPAFPYLRKAYRSGKELIAKADIRDFAGRWKQTKADTEQSFQEICRLASTLEPSVRPIVVLGHMASVESEICNYLNKAAKSMPNSVWVLISETPTLSKEEIGKRICFPFLVIPRIPSSGGFDIGLVPPKCNKSLDTIETKPWILDVITNIRANFPEMNRDYAVFLAEYFSRFCCDALEKLRPQLVVIWNQFLPFHTIMYRVCQEKHIPYAFMEFGSLAGTFALDLQGQMGESGISTNAHHFLALEVSRKEIDRARQVCNFLMQTKINRNLQLNQKNLIKAVQKRCSRLCTTILFFGQSDFESGIHPYTERAAKWHSPVYESSMNALLDLSEICQRQGWNLIYKPHPEMVRRGREKKLPQNVICVKSGNIFDLIKLADVVVTIASQCSYEALIHGVPVVMLGYNQLKGKGCIYEAYEREAVSPTISEAIKEGFTNQQRAAFHLHVAQMLKYALFDDFSLREMRYGRDLGEFVQLLREATNKGGTTLKDIKLLDCTLRDGGYINDWEFGHSTITCIFERLVHAGIDIIEIGFLDERRPFDENRTIQPTTQCYDRIFQCCNKGNAMVVAMIDYGTCGIDQIAPCEESFIDGIRIIFKKSKMRQAVDFARQVIEKGYKVSLQLVSITSYEDRDILNLVDLLNEIKPYGVAMVDTYGLMHKEEMAHYFHLLNHNLNPEILIGYHSHNNFQLGYANEVEMIKRDTQRTLLVDGTAYGIGKSAGNAPLELLAMYLNENYGKKYDIDQILETIDVNIMRIYREHYWGYSLLFFLAASNNCHPNYISYLLNKHTLSVKAINDIAKNIDQESKLNYSQEHIEELYRKYQEQTVFESETIRYLGKALQDRDILLLGPGKSLTTQKGQIGAYITANHPIIISVNCIPDDYKPDYVFIGNSKRYSTLFLAFSQLREACKIIATSNIVSVGKPFDFVFRYDGLRDDNKIIEDNAFIMVLKALSRVGVRAVAAAGFDGFSKQNEKNYYDDYMDFAANYEQLALVNEVVKKHIMDFRQQMQIEFVTKSLYENKNDEI